MYWKTMELKDDIVHSKDDFYKSQVQFLEDAESKDNLDI